jgi:hypothetical protein
VSIEKPPENEVTPEQSFHIPAFGAIRANPPTWLSSANIISESTALTHPPTAGSTGSVGDFVDCIDAVDFVVTGDDGEDEEELVTRRDRGEVVRNALSSRGSPFWVFDLFLSLF